MRRYSSLSAFVTESNLFSLFKISLENFFKTKFYMMYHLKLQPSEIDALEYYEYHYFIKDMSDVLKKQKEGQDNDQQTNDQYGKNSLGSIKTPSVNMPKIRMPAMPKI